MHTARLSMTQQVRVHWNTFVNVSVVAWVVAAIVWSNLISSRAFAASSKPSTFSALHSAAHKIAEGKVIAQSVSWEKGRIVTRSVIAVHECFKGRCGAELELKQFGGAIGGLTMVAHGVTLLKRGDAAFVFVAQDGNSVHRPIGLGRGVVPTAGRRDLDTVRATLRSLKSSN